MRLNFCFFSRHSYLTVSLFERTSSFRHNFMVEYMSYRTCNITTRYISTSLVYRVEWGCMRTIVGVKPSQFPFTASSTDEVLKKESTSPTSRLMESFRDGGMNTEESIQLGPGSPHMAQQSMLLVRIGAYQRNPGLKPTTK